MHAVLDHIQDQAKNIKTFWFKPEHPVDYTAGQFAEWRIPHPHPDERGEKHWFTLSSSPTEDLISFTTKFATDRSSTFKQNLAKFKPGDQLTVTQPMGDFVLPRKTDIPLVFVAGGIGVTPMRSMIKYLVDSGEARTIHLLYAANTLEEIAFRELFEKAPIAFEMLLANPPQRWKGRSGRLTPQDIASLPEVSKGAYVYLSGPEPMVEALVDGLKKLGIDKRRLVTDYFPGYAKV